MANPQAAKKETAEQKLLKMIEASSATAVATGKTQLRIVSKQNLLSIIRQVNQILMGGIVIAGIFLVNEMRVGVILSGKRNNYNPAVINSKTLGKKMEALIPSVQGLPFYMASVNRRNIFQPHEKEQSANVVEVSPKNQRIRGKITNYRLVGIAWFDSVESASVMIEDTEKKVTFFLMKGEKLGDVFIKTIYADSAILGYENEEITIRYDKTQM